MSETFCIVDTSIEQFPFILFEKVCYLSHETTDTPIMPCRGYIIRRTCPFESVPQSCFSDNQGVAMATFQSNHEQGIFPEKNSILVPKCLFTFSYAQMQCLEIFCGHPSNFHLSFSPVHTPSVITKMVPRGHIANSFYCVVSIK